MRILERDAAPALRRFERERALRGALGEAEGFVPVLSTGISLDGPSIVTPFLPWPSLRDRLARGPLGYEETRELAVSLARALGRAHKVGYVHLDLRPERILLAPSGPLISDLGIARHFSRAEERGESSYAAPEQRRGERALGFEADVRAVGAILAECLAGEPPLASESASSLVARARLSRPVARVPRSFLRVLDRALAPDPHDRYGSGNALALALRIQGSLGRLGAAALLLALAGATLLVASPVLFVRLAGVSFAAQLVAYAFMSIEGLDLQAGEHRKTRAPH